MNTQANTTSPAKLSPVRYLDCCCCGGEARGRQWHNRDKGYGICGKCVAYVAKHESPEEMQENYGTPGVHHSIN